MGVNKEEIEEAVGKAISELVEEEEISELEEREIEFIIERISRKIDPEEVLAGGTSDDENNEDNGDGTETSEETSESSDGTDNGNDKIKEEMEKIREALEDLVEEIKEANRLDLSELSDN